MLAAVTAGTAGGELHVLRLASVFEPSRHLTGRRCARYVPIGGMQTHTAALSRYVDRERIRQTVVTAACTAHGAGRRSVPAARSSG